jgi:hypothetical protein
VLLVPGGAVGAKAAPVKLTDPAGSITMRLEPAITSAIAK